MLWRRKEEVEEEEEKTMMTTEIGQRSAGVQGGRAKAISKWHHVNKPETACSDITGVVNCLCLGPEAGMR